MILFTPTINDGLFSYYIFFMSSYYFLFFLFFFILCYFSLFCFTCDIICLYTFFQLVLYMNTTDYNKLTRMYQKLNIGSSPHFIEVIQHLKGREREKEN